MLTTNPQELPIPMDFEKKEKTPPGNFV